jgi:hypothetical protein
MNEWKVVSTQVDELKKLVEQSEIHFNTVRVV